MNTLLPLRFRATLRCLLSKIPFTLKIEYDIQAKLKCVGGYDSWTDWDTGFQSKELAKNTATKRYTEYLQVGIREWRVIPRLRFKRKN